MSQESASTQIVRPSGRRKGLPGKTDLYLCNAARRWGKALASADRVLIFSPYLTSRLPATLIDSSPAGRCEVYTVFRAENFAAGASSIHTLLELQGKGVPLYD